MSDAPDTVVVSEELVFDDILSRPRALRLAVNPDLVRRATHLHVNGTCVKRREGPACGTDGDL